MNEKGKLSGKVRGGGGCSRDFNFRFFLKKKKEKTIATCGT